MLMVGSGEMEMSGMELGEALADIAAEDAGSVGEASIT